ncbi:sensor histidine kinase N-terminal domain-containing protein [Ramlibacter sp. H39-3-26]|uniref:sensor histidine kinase n=1 Tax=Curvibacter soli TaxID=3031331 RepID=UPI0023DA9B66|nr:sensor histidine kinase [Ramlibacter sp. H39-3-26]MDF1484023.1 sensor histidine kinase N-terminal domain-containing protein [Ramlibacter sp. H39-3-26]
MNAPGATRLSLRRRLLAGILLPVAAIVAFNTASLYRETLIALNTAYDRTLLASAKTISEQLDVQGYDDQATLRATVPYAALEAFETDNHTRMVYRVSTLRGEVISGFPELPFWHGSIPQRPPYAALVDFYDDSFRGQPVRVAVLLQPVASTRGRSMAVIQVAETLQLRHALAREILWDTVRLQTLLLGVVALVVVLVVQSATRPVRRLSAELQARPEGDLTPIAAPDAPRELQPLVEATNHVMARLAQLLAQQLRFVRDAAHQLRTPLAVLKTQTQSAQRGDLPPAQALAEIAGTVARATQLANQMLALARVEQTRQQQPGEQSVADWAAQVRALALELSPLVAERDLDFGIATVPAPVCAPAWMLRELSRNLLHNAIRHAPVGSVLAVDLRLEPPGQPAWAVLTIADQGPGVSEELAARLFEPFSTGGAHGGTGLGLTICREIARALGGSVALANRTGTDGAAAGLDAVARLPVVNNGQTRDLQNYFCRNSSKFA